MSKEPSSKVIFENSDVNSQRYIQIIQTDPFRTIFILQPSTWLFAISTFHKKVKDQTMHFNFVFVVLLVVMCVVADIMKEDGTAALLLEIEQHTAKLLIKQQAIGCGKHTGIPGYSQEEDDR